MNACVILGARDMHIEQRPEPEVSPGYALVRVDAASVCGTDVHQFEGTLGSSFPRVPGHDFSGTIVAIDGQTQTERQVGERVAVKPSFPCGNCAACAELRFADCPNKRLIGLHSDGCMVDFIAAPIANLIPLPAGVSSAAAAMIEPFAVALNAFSRISLPPDATVAIVGQGPIGLAQTRFAALNGAARIFAIDTREAPFEVSRAYGATDCLNATKIDVVQAILDATGGRGVDVALETSGARAGVETMLRVVRKEGTTVNIGLTNDIGGIDVATIVLKTLTCLGVGGNGGRGQYERVLELMEAGQIDAEAMVTHRFPLEQAPNAFNLALDPQRSTIKIVLFPNKTVV